MAATAITAASVPLGGSVAIPATAALNATDGALVTFGGKDTRTLILLENSAGAEGTATIKKGDGIQGVADLVVTLAASTTVGVVIESGPYKNVGGENKGKVHITGAATIKVAAVELP